MLDRVFDVAESTLFPTGKISNMSRHSKSQMYNLANKYHENDLVYLDDGNTFSAESYVSQEDFIKMVIKLESFPVKELMPVR